MPNIKVHENRLPVNLQQLVSSTEDLIRNARAPSTRRAYASHWKAFEAFMAEHHLPWPAQPQHVALFCAHLSQGGYSLASIRTMLAAVATTHQAEFGNNPVRSEVVRQTLQGAKRVLPNQQAQKAAITSAQVRAMADLCEDTPVGHRNRALILVSYSGFFRRSEVTQLEWAQVAVNESGASITLTRSKTSLDPETIAICRTFTPYCPVAALEKLRGTIGSTGPVFPRIRKGQRVTGKPITPQVLNFLVKSLGRQIGLRPEMLGAHSLRAGGCSTALENSANLVAVAKQGRWRNLNTVKRYSRGNPFTDNASKLLGI